MPQTRRRRTMPDVSGLFRILLSLVLAAWLGLAQGCATAPPLATTEFGSVALEGGWRSICR